MQSNAIRNIFGNESENKTAIFLKRCGYWAYILPKKVGGQPFDIIACKNNITWFIDVKHLESGVASFAFDRIEPNQKTAMSYARNFANITNIGFVISWDRADGELFFFPYSKWIEMERDGHKSIKIEELDKLEKLL